MSTSFRNGFEELAVTHSQEGIIQQMFGNIELALGGWSFSPWYTQNYLSTEVGTGNNLLLLV